MTDKNKYFDADITRMIKLLLELHPSCRDNDKILIAKVLKGLCKKNIEEITAKQFLLWFIYEAPTPESITRARRKIQEAHPETRGANWGKRHLEMQEQVVEELKNEFD